MSLKLLGRGHICADNLTMNIEAKTSHSNNDNILELTKNKVEKSLNHSTQNLMNTMLRRAEFEESKSLNLIKQHRKSFSDSGYSSCSSDTPSPEPGYFMENKLITVDPERSCLTPGSQNRLQKLKKPEKQCHVCGETAHGNFFGAIVCLPCKTFFIRCTTEDASTFVCRQNDGNCDVTGINRSRCKYCRFQKCLQHGMNRKERPEQVVIQEGQQLCKICGDVANGVHFGVISCEGCKKFFRRGLQESDSYVCKVEGKCTINPRTRNDCRYCRFERCLAVGMSTSAIKMGRPRKTNQEECMVVKTLPLKDICEDIPNHQQESKMVYPAVSHPYIQQSFMQQFPAAVLPAVRNVQQLNNSISNNSIQTGRPSVMSNYSVSSPLMVPSCFPPNSVLPIKRSMIETDHPTLPPCKQLKTEATTCVTNHSPTVSHSSYQYNIKKADSSSVTQSGQLRTDHLKPESAMPKVENNLHLKSGDCVIVKKEVIDLDYEICSVKEKPSLHIDSSSKIEDKPRSVKLADKPYHDMPFGHKYDNNYWNVLSQQYRQLSPLCESQQKLVTTLASAYLELVESFCKGAQVSQDNTEKETSLSQKRFIHYISAVINFMRSIPGFCEMHNDDKYMILRLGAIQVCAIVASVHLYNPVQNVFIKSFFDENLDPDHPTYMFQQALLTLAKTIHSFNLDNMEAAFLCALLSLATDWPNLQRAEKIEKIRNELLCTLKSYISMKYGDKEDRIKDLFSFIPSLRKLGMWHYKLSYESSFT